MSKNKKVRNVVPAIYIIEAITPANGTYYKVGFTDVDNTSRPDGLVKEYKELHPDNKVQLLELIQLPLLQKKKYFNDNMVRDEMYVLNFLNIRSVDPAYIAKIIGVDGKNEFVEVLSPDIDIKVAVHQAIDSLAKSDSNYKYDIRNIIAYDTTLPHLVNGYMIEKLENYYKQRISQLQQKTILLVGQFEPDWLAAVAINNKVYIIADDADARPVFKYNYLNETITYVNNIEEIIDMSIPFDLVVSNPPYGSTGANITQTIKDDINYKEFFNLLPANDYKRNDDRDLFNYQSDMECVTKTGVTSELKFDDAVVTTHIAKIHKNKVNNMTEDEFEISNYLDKSLNKYFLANIKAIPNKAIKESISWIYFNGNLENTKTVLLDHRFIGHKHLAFSKNVDEYKWNVEKSIDLAYLARNSASPSTPGKLNKYTITFDTPEEKDNFVEFIYSNDGFRFISKIATACNGDSTKPLYFLLPNVDWTRKWTVAEILANYGYTPAEIKEVIDDLKNYKGMD